jgi:hypothetical protein
MKALHGILPLLALAAFSLRGWADEVSWGQTIFSLNGPSDIQTNGTFFDAINTTTNGSYDTTTIGDTTFNALVNGTDGTMSLTISGGDGNFSSTYSGSSSAVYNYVVGHATDSSGSTVTIGSALHPLTLGDEYQIQVWGYWPNQKYGAELNGDPSVSFPNGGGGYALGTFTATAAMQTFTYQGNSDSFGAGFVDDIAVRAVPEPSIVLLLLGGLAVSALVIRRRIGV